MVGPRRGPGGHRQPLAVQQPADAVLNRRPPTHQLRAVQDQRPPLTYPRRRHVHRRQLTRGRELRELERVVPVGLPLDVLPTPCLVVGVGHLQRNAQALAQVTHPARRRADLDDHPIRLTLDDQVVQHRGFGLDRGEGVGEGRRVIITGHRREFTQIDREDPQGTRGLDASGGGGRIRHVGSPGKR